MKEVHEINETVANALQRGVDDDLTSLEDELDEFLSTSDDAATLPAAVAHAQPLLPIPRPPAGSKRASLQGAGGVVAYTDKESTGSHGGGVFESETSPMLAQ
eukprot:2534279-Rhodomonas_salina.1